MKKNYGIYTCTIFLIFPIFGLSLPPVHDQDHPKKRRKLNPSSLEFLATKQVFNFHNNLYQRENLKQIFQNPDLRVNAFKFNGQIINDIDLSEFYLLGLDLSGCTFNGTNFSNANLVDIRLRNTILNNVSLRGADLRITFSDPNYFKGAVFNNVDLEGALLYGDTEEEYLYLKGKSDPYNLVKQYSSLMKQARSKRQEGLFSQAEIFVAQAKALSKLFHAIPLNLEHKDLSNLNFTDLDLSNANLKDATITVLRLSESVIVPYYTSPSELFDKWINGNLEEQALYQKLLNTRFNFFSRVHNQSLRRIDWFTKDLRNANFSYSNLHKCDFRGVNLDGLNLEEAYLSGLRLSNNVILPEYIDNEEDFSWHITFFNKWMNGIPEEQVLYQKLLHTGFNFLSGVPNDLLQMVSWPTKDLRNANFTYANLEDCNFVEANLEKANLGGAQLQGANLSRAQLKQVDLCEANLTTAQLQSANLEGANLEKANLYGSQLQGANLRRANLKSATLKGTNLDEAQLQEANLTKVNFKRCIFNKTNLSKANLSNCSLKKADLRTTFSDPNYFKEAILENVNLEGALLYGNTEEEYLYLKGKSDPHNLVHQYSDLMQKARTGTENGSIEKAELFCRQAQAINKLFSAIPLELQNENLRDLNFTGLDLSHANLERTDIRGVRLSQNVVVPHYKNQSEFLEIFDQWSHGTLEEQNISQILLKAQVSFTNPKGDLIPIKFMHYKPK